ncbi:MAG TPA: agmatinase [Candidatus Thalassarchaeaceae archaeon]|nr:agmatinase [Candidatus Thalassarchaeaceae archaeon]
MEGSESPTFLGLEESDSGPWDIVLLQIPLELTASYGEGTRYGPRACIDASSQVELHDPMLPEELPCGAEIHTAEPWSSDALSLREQLDSIREYVRPWIVGGQFPLVLGGEHGILLPIVESLSDHHLISNLSNLTIVQIDAHADLRDELNGERFSHGTVIRRVLDLGVGRVIQIGIRAFSLEEEMLMKSEERIQTWFARNLLTVSDGNLEWSRMMDSLAEISGPVWLTFDVDGLDGSLVPSTGTPVPGGLSHWGSVEIIEKIFSSEKCEVIGVDVNEIVPGKEGNMTQFSAAMIAAKMAACHIANFSNRKGE